ncbi:MAG: gamma-glutamylcyclotransferase [Dongiaceae bacterium]
MTKQTQARTRHPREKHAVQMSVAQTGVAQTRVTQARVAQAAVVQASDNILSMIQTYLTAASSGASARVSSRAAADAAMAEKRDRSLLSVWEIDASLDAVLAQHDAAADLWLFGYNALMWNPIVDYDKAQTGLLRGWHREFCIWAPSGRGMFGDPGLTLALEPGGESHGRLFRIPAERVRNELRMVWQSEMSTGIFGAEWVQVETGETSLRALTFVADPTHPAYIGKLTDAEIIACLAKSRGMLGGCSDNLKQMIVALDHLGLSDPMLERFVRRIRRMRR